MADHIADIGSDIDAGKVMLVLILMLMLMLMPEKKTLVVGHLGGDG